jgi:hypothetical protein
MMAVSTYSTPNILLTGNPDAAPDIEELRSNSLLLDMLSYRGSAAFLDQTRILNDNGANPLVLSRVSFIYRTGYTFAVFTLRSNVSSGTLNLIFNGAVLSSTSISSGLNTVSVAVTGRGYTDYQFVDVIASIAITWSGSNVFELLDAYVAPAASVMTTSWPGVPTFGANSAANLAQLATAQQWLMDRINLAVTPLFMTQQYRGMASWASTDPVWQGTIWKTNGHNYLSLIFGHITLTNVAEHIEVFVAGSLAYTGPTWTAGDNGNLNVNIDISGYADETLLSVNITFVCVTGSASTSGWKESRLILANIWTQRTTIAPATPPTVSTIRESITFATLQSRLNAIATITLNAYSRMIAATSAFNNVRMFRWMPAVDDGQRAYFALSNLYIPGAYRGFDALWVRGKNLKIAYGTRKLTTDADNAYKLNFMFEQDLISGSDQVQDKLVYLDSFPGLYPGMDFYILGEDVRAAFAQLR